MRRDIADNNFDLIRLCAALQVAILHVTHNLSVQFSAAPWAQLLEVFPGVPVFFFISGFLISRSYERSKTLRDYAINRTLRIFPALHVCVFLNIIAIALTGYFHTVGANVFDVTVLYLAKTTFFQFYNPDFMRKFGDGVLNGSLWTLCVELQFYLLTPVIYYCLVSRNKVRSDVFLALLLLISLLCNRVVYHLQVEYFASVGWKLARVSFFPWIYMFLAGVLAQRNFERIKHLLSARSFWLALLLYTAYASGMRWVGYGMDNSFSPLLFFPLVFLICTAAYYPSNIAKRLLHGNDVSYGIYIYHVPVMNMFLFYGLFGSIGFTVATLAITVILAIASWVGIEKPSLMHKLRPMHPTAARGN
jgi:peptidoglycan/LPS O-acetylase OafA/YrhL